MRRTHETDIEAIARVRGFAAGRKEGLVQGFAACEALVVAMLSSFAEVRPAESLRDSVKRLLREDFDPDNADDVVDKLLDLLRTRTLREAALAVSLDQHQTDAYDPNEILAAHRAVVNRSQAAAAGRAGGIAAAATMSKKAKTARARNAAKARHGQAKGEIA